MPYVGELLVNTDAKKAKKIKSHESSWEIYHLDDLGKNRLDYKKRFLYLLVWSAILGRYLNLSMKNNSRAIRNDAQDQYLFIKIAKFGQKSGPIRPKMNLLSVMPFMLRYIYSNEHIRLVRLLLIQKQQLDKILPPT